MLENFVVAPPRIAVVVLSYGPRRTLGEAIRSILEQDIEAELVVVHSGPGDVESHLSPGDRRERLVLSQDRLLPGGARNRGIATTTAPYIAFLADDCRAAPGWLAARLRAHEEGARAVASAVVSHRPHRPIALAAHLSLFVRRMPLADPSLALRYGASYDRSLFTQYGMFREDMEGGEDTEFHKRLSEDDKPVWRPEIQTIHRGAERLGEFLREQSRRGRRSAEAWQAIGTLSPREVARSALRRTRVITRESRQVVEPHQRLTRLLALPFIAAGNISYAWGALKARSKP
jgi:glycosyltransferase involved in cell wall biosynthesis